MCGIFALISPKGRFSRSQVNKALATLNHRGPNASEIYHSSLEDQDLWFGHTRLAIIGLGDEGAQPLVERNDVLTFNGEIYNYVELSAAHGIPASGSDTRILFEGWRKLGQDFLRQVNGMAAAVFYRADAQRFEIFRDHAGKKPLYIYRKNGICAIASEIKVFRALGLHLEISTEALATYEAFGFIPARLSVYNEVQKFPAGSFGLLNLKTYECSEELLFPPFEGYRETFRGTFHDAKAEFWDLFVESVKLRLRADVPVGLFLSGGIDSTLVALALNELKHDTTAFSVEVDRKDFNESDAAQRTAARLGIPLTKVVLDASAFEKHRRDYVDCFDEPLADISSVAMLALSETASQRVKVVLSGDGGDESFIGYPSTFVPEKFGHLRPLRKLPLISVFSERVLSSQTTTASLAHLTNLISKDPTTVREKAYFLWLMLSTSEPEATYAAFRSKPWMKEHNPWWLYREWYPELDWESLDNRTVTERLSALDYISYMRDGVLVKVDRTTMRYGLEARSPFLDRRIVSFAQSLPAEFKYSAGTFKRILRATLVEKDPIAASRPKSGFGVPIPGKPDKMENEFRRWQKSALADWKIKYGG